MHLRGGGGLLVFPFLVKEEKQCSECRLCSPIQKVCREFSVDSFQK